MIGRCHFTKNPADVPGILTGITGFNEVHCLYTSKSPLFDPSLLALPDIAFIDFENYGSSTKEVLQDNENNALVVLGISDMMTPANRCDQRYEYAFNYSKYGCKYSIDTVPFKDEIWRIMWPYSLLRTTIMEYNHSFAAESAYRAWQDGRLAERPLQVPWIVSKVGEHTKMHYQKFFDFEINFDEHHVTDEQQEEYYVLKEELFDTKTNIKSIIKGLTDYAKSICPERNIFSDMKKLYNIREEMTFHVTDLKVDLYLRSEIERIVSETNDLTEALYEA